MKKDLTITSKIELSRREIVSIVSEWIQKEHNLKLEKAISLDSQEKPVDFSNMICYVHQAAKQPIIKDYDGPEKHKVRPGFSRPNWGIGKLLGEILADGEIYSFAEIKKEVVPQFPHMTDKLIKKYLARPQMVGFEVNHQNGHYQKKGLPETVVK